MRIRAFCATLALKLCSVPIVAVVGVGGAANAAPGAPSRTDLALVAPEHLRESCSLLDDSTARGLMSGAFETRLLIACGRSDELGGVVSEATGEIVSALGTDVLANNPSSDVGGSSFTQSETSLARSVTNGVLCAAYNDSFHGVTQGTGYSGFSHSSDNGVTWIDHGVIPAGGGGQSQGDPSNVWSRRDNKFYHASLHPNGLGLWSLGTGCTSASWVGLIHNGVDDKEMMAVDNSVGSPYYGRLYVTWSLVSGGSRRIYLAFSNNGTSWTTPLVLSAAGVNTQGPWPAVAPNGDVYVAWVRWNPYPTGPIDIEVVRSTNGGSSFSSVTSPASGKTNPRDATATSSCSRPALRGYVRYLPSPQIAVDASNVLHVVYSYDPDGYNTGDVVDVYYRRSANQGAGWGPEIRVNDDATTADQFFPALAVNDAGTVTVLWYDRRDDANNTNFYYYRAVSEDGGESFGPNERVSDVQSPVVLDPNLATCYHGDYDTSVADSCRVYMQWSDDRRGDPDVYVDTLELGACGNGVKEGCEQCDGSDLGGATCVDRSCGSGSVACNASCQLDYSGCTCCEEWINPNASSGPIPGTNTAFPQPTLIYDDNDGTGSTGFVSSMCCTLGHKFMWAAGTRSGTARIILADNTNAGTARAYYSRDAGATWTQFASTTSTSPMVFYSTPLTLVNLATFQVKVLCSTSYPDSGTCTAYELDFVADPEPPCP